MELPKGLVGFARRAASELPTGTFDSLIRSVGEAKSNADEAELVRKMISIVKDGLTSNSQTPKAQRDLLLYLVYIDMLGNDTAWAHPAVITLCSSKNLLVKKVAYLTASLLIDPTSELTIMVTATIQSDLRSDNFLIVCAAQQAVCRFASSELISVFLPQMTALLRHDRDIVKKKALMVLHRFLQLDPALAQDIDRHFIEKLGYKEPSVMVAALCGLTELISSNPKAYLNLVHYFTSILKQAAEGKLGRAYDYHRAPAPFVQLYLLRLLRMLGAADAACADNMASVIAEVWRRAETLGNNIGNALVYECLRTAAAIQHPDIFARHKIASITRLLSSRDHNLKYAAIDVLSRLVDDDLDAAQQHQYAVVECLRSADTTLKRKTLGLLYAMAGSNNVEVVAREALQYIKETEDESARRDAATKLCDLAERFGPDPGWFIDVTNEVLLTVGDVLPPSIGDHLISLIAEETSGNNNNGSDAISKKYVEVYLELLDRPKLPAILLKVICWMVGEHGGLSRDGCTGAMDRLAGVAETQAATDEVNSHLITALGKLGVKSLGQLTPDASRYLHSMCSCEVASLQQQAVEVRELLRASSDVQAAAFSGSAFGDIAIDTKLSFLDAYESKAMQAGAAPHIGLKDRVAMGMSSAPDTYSRGGGSGGVGRPRHQLKFNAYEKTEAPSPVSAAAAVTEAAASSPSGGGSGGIMNLSGSSFDSGIQQQPQQAPAAPAEPKLLIKKDRKWGPNATTPAVTQQPSSPAPASSTQQGASSASGGSPLQDFSGAKWNAPSPSSTTNTSRRNEPAPAAVQRDPEKERLAASLFGGGGGGSTSGSARTGGWRSGGHQQTKASPEAPNLIGDLLGGDEGQQQAGGSVMDLLGELEAPAAGTSTNAATSDDIFSFMNTTTAGGNSSAPAVGGQSQFDQMFGSTSFGGQEQQPSMVKPSPPKPPPPKPKDPFASLLD